MSKCSRQTVHSELTFELPCSEGDMALHFRWAFLEGQVAILDMWYLMDGDRLTLTTQADGLPTWWRLHPTEVCDGLACRLLERFNRRDYPSVPVEAPNLWRLRDGDSLAFIRRTDDERGVGVVLYEMDLCGAIILHPWCTTSDPTEIMRAPPDPMPVVAIERAQIATAAVRQIGPPVSFSEAWRMKY